MSDAERELIAAVLAFVDRRFAGDREAAFNAYAVNGRLSLAGVKRFLTDADAGSWLFRTATGRAIIKAMDDNKDGTIDWAEFQKHVEPAQGTSQDHPSNPGDRTGLG